MADVSVTKSVSSESRIMNPFKWVVARWWFIILIPVIQHNRLWDVESCPAIYSNDRIYFH